MQRLSLSFRQSKKNLWSLSVLKKNNILRKVILTIIETKLIEYDVMWGVYRLYSSGLGLRLWFATHHHICDLR